MKLLFTWLLVISGCSVGSWVLNDDNFYNNLPRAFLSFLKGRNYWSDYTDSCDSFKKLNKYLRLGNGGRIRFLGCGVYRLIFII